MAVVVVVLGAAAVAAALLAWPQVALQPDDEALAQVVQPGYAGHVSTVAVTNGSGQAIPIAASRRQALARAWLSRPVSR